MKEKYLQLIALTLHYMAGPVLVRTGTGVNQTIYCKMKSLMIQIYKTAKTFQLVYAVPIIGCLGLNQIAFRPRVDFLGRDR